MRASVHTWAALVLLFGVVLLLLTGRVVHAARRLLATLYGGLRSLNRQEETECYARRCACLSEALLPRCPRRANEFLFAQHSSSRRGQPSRPLCRQARSLPIALCILLFAHRSVRVALLRVALTGALPAASGSFVHCEAIRRPLSSGVSSCATDQPERARTHTRPRHARPPYSCSPRARRRAHRRVPQGPRQPTASVLALKQRGVRAQQRPVASTAAASITLPRGKPPAAVPPALAPLQLVPPG